jgi:hypothetical protein
MRTAGQLIATVSRLALTILRDSAAGKPVRFISRSSPFHCQRLASGERGAVKDSESGFIAADPVAF